MRLDKYLCSATELTRSLAKKLLHRGDVTCDGEVIKDPGFKVAEHHLICIDGEPVTPMGERYLMLYKPDGCVSSHVDDGYPSVLIHIEQLRREELKIVGRLDADTTGLLLLTTDGQWSHRITSPNSRCPKCYRVSLANPIEQRQLDALNTGVLLHGESDPVSGKAEQIDSHSLWLTIAEGKYHQVKRMCAAAGNKVVGLHRHSIGGLTLDPALAPGEWRALAPEEIAQF